jgi:hypothetical protein
MALHNGSQMMLPIEIRCKFVKFKWIDDEPHCYFEMEIVQDELTNDVALAITDFATEDAIPDRKLIWDNQIQYLISVLGA